MFGREVPDLISLSFRGRTPGQILSIALWKTFRLYRRIWPPFLKWLCRFRQEAWISNPGDLTYTLSESDAAEILKRHEKIRPEIREEAEHVLSGLTEVPGFGRRRINLIPPVAEVGKEEAYAWRLLSRLDFLRVLVRSSLIDYNYDGCIQAVESHLRGWWNLRKRSRTWDSVDDAIRALNVMEALALLGERISREAFRAGLRCVLEAIWNIEINRARTGNHLVYEGLALYYAGTVLATYRRAKTWRRLGREILEAEIRRQVTDDGMNAELCTNYHLITGTNFLKALVLARKSGSDFSTEYVRRVVHMAVVAHRLRASDGSYFALGDSDRMAGRSREEREARAFSELGEALLGNGSAGKSDLELEWLWVGVDLSSLTVGEKSVKSVNSFGGYQLLRDVAGRKLIFDTGSFGLESASHHGHADSLSFEFHLPDGRFLVDPGGFSYVDEAARGFARSTAAHNTVRIDGKDSSEIRGSFGFGRGAEAQYLDFREFDHCRVLVGEHNGYRRRLNGNSPVTHRRALINLEGSAVFFLVLDTVEGHDEHCAEAFFHGDVGWKVQVENRCIAIWSKNSHRIAQHIWAEGEFEMSVHEGESTPEWQGWISPAFGHYVAAPTLCIKCRGPAPLELASVFCSEYDVPVSVLSEGAARKIQVSGKPLLSWEWIGTHFEVKSHPESWN